MLLWTGLMITSSSILRSRASTALLGLSSDSWERDSFSLGIRWDLREEEGERGLSQGERGSICAARINKLGGERARGWRREDAALASKSSSSQRDEPATPLCSNTCSRTHFWAGLLMDALRLLIYDLNEWKSLKDWVKLRCQLRQRNPLEIGSTLCHWLSLMVGLRPFPWCDNAPLASFI